MRVIIHVMGILGGIKEIYVNELATDPHPSSRDVRPMSLAPTNSEFPSAALKEALIVALADCAFNDTAYYLFSRRTASGKVGGPRAVYANSSVMKAAAEHFRAQLSAEFSIYDAVPKEAEGYTYDEDSDIEDTDNVENFDMGIPGDSESISPTKSCINKPARGKPKAGVPDKSLASSAAADIARGVIYRVFVPDVAATTWKAMIYYLYTGTISFAPLTSGGPQRPTSLDLATSKRPPLCSPKSAYRLADIIGSPSLKKIAEAAIKSQLSESSIAKEIFSSFSSYYPEILDAEIHFLFEHGILARVLPQIHESIITAVRSGVPHAEIALCSLVSKLSEAHVLGHSARPQTDASITSTETSVTNHMPSCACERCRRRRSFIRSKLRNNV